MPCSVSGSLLILLFRIMAVKSSSSRSRTAVPSERSEASTISVISRNSCDEPGVNSDQTVEDLPVPLPDENESVGEQGPQDSCGKRDSERHTEACQQHFVAVVIQEGAIIMKVRFFFDGPMFPSSVIQFLRTLIFLNGIAAIDDE